MRYSSQVKPISYLNILDADAAWNLVTEFSSLAAVCVKHANPSGVATGETITDAFQRAYDAGETTCSSRLPSGFLRAPSIAGSSVSFWKKPALTSRLTRGG